MFEFSDSRSGHNGFELLRLDTPQAWQGTLVADGFGSDTAIATKGVRPAHRMAYARHKLHELWVNHGSDVACQALRFHQSLLSFEREIERLPAGEPRRIRQRRSR